MSETLSSRLNPFGIYVHIPFCRHKCSYCDFYSFTQFQSEDKRSFTDQLLEEIESAAGVLRKQAECRPVTSLFFGGGTPSLLEVDSLVAIFTTLQEQFVFSHDIEITLEANPETVTDELAESWRKRTPITRISLGAQSFQPKYLAALERLASPETVVRASEILRRTGFEDFNLDLIVGIPGQTPEELQEDIRSAAALKPTHISNYNLSLKPGHPLYANLPDEELSADCYETARDCLEALGYEQYEISNYARPGKRCRHNLLYWSGGDFLGLGPSAASRFFWDGVFHHRKQFADMKRYAEHLDFSSVPFEKSTRDQTALEGVFLELRTREGIGLSEFTERYGHDPRTVGKFGLLKREGLVIQEGNWLRFTKKGQLLADSIATELAP